MMYNDRQGYRDCLRHAVERKGVSHIQRHCQTAYEERIAGEGKNNSKAHYNCMLSEAAARKIVGREKNRRGIRSTGRQGKSDCLLKFFQAIYRRDQGTRGQTLGPVTLSVEMPDEAITRSEGQPKNGRVESGGV